MTQPHPPTIMPCPQGQRTYLQQHMLRAGSFRQGLYKVRPSVGWLVKHSLHSQSDPLSRLLLGKSDAGKQAGRQAASHY